MTHLTEQEQARALLLKYRNRQCTPQEEELVHQWFEAMGEDAVLPEEKDIDHSVSELVPRILRAIRRKPAAPRRMHIWRAAAAAAVLAIGLLVYWLRPSYQTIITARGERREITLPDGTQVFLNAASELKFRKGFSAQEREVWLDGEGFFSVTHDPARPFTVHAAGLDTRVLGTSFDIKAYPESIVQVVVRTGKVAVYKDETAIAPGLAGNGSLRYDPRSGRYAVSGCDAERFTSWKNGGFYFEEASIGDIARAIARHFDVNVELSGPAPVNCRYTMHFKQQSLPEMLSLLRGLTGVTYNINGREIIINPQTCN